MARGSALSEALISIGDRWSLVIVDALTEGPLRFADLQDRVDGISTNILAARLRHLEGQGVVMAVPYSERPLRYTYDLTDAGRDLAGATRVLAQWSADHSGPSRPDRSGRREPKGASGGTPVHPSCGTSMVAVWWCPTCEQPAGAEPEDIVWV